MLGVGNQGRLAALLAGQVVDEESLERLELVPKDLGDGVKFGGTFCGGETSRVAVLVLEFTDRLEVHQVTTQ